MIIEAMAQVSQWILYSQRWMIGMDDSDGLHERVPELPRTNHPMIIELDWWHQVSHWWILYSQRWIIGLDGRVRNSLPDIIGHRSLDSQRWCREFRHSLYHPALSLSGLMAQVESVNSLLSSMDDREFPGWPSLSSIVESREFSTHLCHLYDHWWLVDEFPDSLVPFSIIHRWK